MSFPVAIDQLQGGLGGHVAISDILPVAGGDIISAKVFQDASSTILQSCTASATTIRVQVRASEASVQVNGIPGTLTQQTGDIFTGTVDITLAGTGTAEEVKAQVVSSDGALANDDTCQVTVTAGPELLTLSFTGGYPGTQTELKAGDTFQITGTTDVTADAVEVQNFGASDSVQLLAFAAGTSFTVTMTIGDQGTTPQLLAARVRARNVAGAFGSTRDTNELGGSVNGTDLVNLNNLGPSFVDNGTTFPGGQTAFKGTEAGSQDTSVNDFDTLTYSSPNSDFVIGSPGVFVQDKPITCSNPGTYNDSVNNFQISANRAANDFTNVFAKVIEVADTAPTITVTQPQARLRSGGNDGTAVQQYLITATSDQNLAGAPDVGVGVDGTFIGGGFVGGPKVFTRTLEIDDDDTKGTGAWILNSGVTNNAGLSASIAGTQNNGGFVARDVTFAAFSQTATINVAVTTYTSLTAGIFTATNQPALLNGTQGDTSDIDDTYTVTAIGANPTTVFWNDLDAANSNSGGTAQLTNLEETV